MHGSVCGFPLCAVFLNRTKQKRLRPDDEDEHKEAYDGQRYFNFCTILLWMEMFGFIRSSYERRMYDEAEVF